MEFSVVVGTTIKCTQTSSWDETQSECMHFNPYFSHVLILVLLSFLPILPAGIFEGGFFWVKNTEEYGSTVYYLVNKKECACVYDSLTMCVWVSNISSMLLF